MAAPNLKQLKCLAAHSNYIVDARFSPDCSKLATASTDDTAIIWDTRTWAEVYRLSPHNQVLSVAWNPKHDEILTGSYGVYAWNSVTGKYLLRIEGDWVHSIEWFSHGEEFACGDQNGYLAIYNRGGMQRCVHEFGEHWNFVAGLRLVDDTRIVAVASSKNAFKYKVCMFAYTDDELTIVWEKDGYGYWSRMSPLIDERYFFVGSTENRYYDMWDMQLKMIVKQYKREQKGWSRAITAGSKSEYVVGGDFKDVVLWNKETGERLARISGHTEWIHGVLVHPNDPTKLITYAEDGTLIIWRLETSGTLGVNGVDMQRAPSDTSAVEMEDMQLQIESNKQTIEALTSQVRQLNQEVQNLMGALAKVDKMQETIATLNKTIARLSEPKDRNVRRLSLNLGAGRKSSPSPTLAPASPSLVTPLSPKPGKTIHATNGNMLLVTSSDTLPRRSIEVSRNDYASPIAPARDVFTIQSFKLNEGDMITIRLYQTTRFLAYARSTIGGKELDHFAFKEHASAKEAAVDDNCIFFVCDVFDGKLTLQSVSTTKYLVFKDEKELSSHGSIGCAAETQPRPNIASVDIPTDSIASDGMGAGAYMRFKGPKNLFVSAVDVIKTPKKTHTILATKSIRPNILNLFVVSKVTEE